MNKVEQEIRKVKVFYIATVDENNQPRVRPFGSVLEYEGHVYLCSGNFKPFYKQVSNNPNVELCGMYDDGMSWLRVTASLEEDDRVEVQEAMLNDPTGPKGLYQPGDGRFVTFKLNNVKAMKYSFVKAPEEIKE